MKKVLFASTALICLGGMAAAEVTLNGNGRFGLVYADNGVASDTFLSYRLRFNINAKTETDSGVTFGGRIRLQYDYSDTVESGLGAAELNVAQLYAETGGFRFELGNSNTAFDSLGTLYNAELGFISSTTGSYSRFSYAGYSSGPFSAANANRVGIFASYSVGSIVARVSYIDFDQFGASAQEDEVGISLDYETGPFKLGFGYAQNAGGNANYDVYALLGEYALNDTTNIGLQFIGENGAEEDSTITLYGNTKLAGGIGLGAFVTALSTNAVVQDDFAIGIGASYDLGGATLAGTIQKGYNNDTYADLGVSFSF